MALDIDFDQAVEEQKFNLQVRQEAARQISEQTSKFRPVRVTNQRMEPEEIRYRIDGLLPVDGYVLIHARRKSGKTTLVGNLVKSLIRGTKFLGEFDVHAFNRVALLDLEMSENNHAVWLKDMALFAEPDLYTDYLRGRALSLPLFDDERRLELADHLSDLGIDVLIVDPLGPLLRAYGIDENSNSEVGRVVDALVKLKTEAHIGELVIVHHQGKDGGQGSRGASVLEDTPDVIWTMSGPSGRPADKLSAFGRDVDQVVRLSYEPSSRELTGSRAEDDERSRFEEQSGGNTSAILEAIKSEPGMSGGTVEAAARAAGYVGNKPKFLADLRGLEQTETIVNRGTERRPKWHTAGDI